MLGFRLVGCALLAGACGGIFLAAPVGVPRYVLLNFLVLVVALEALWRLSGHRVDFVTRVGHPSRMRRAGWVRRILAVVVLAGSPSVEELRYP